MATRTLSRVSFETGPIGTIYAKTAADSADVVYDFYGERREPLHRASAARTIILNSVLTWLTVATCSADQRIKLFRRSNEGSWDLETEWKVRSQRSAARVVCTLTAANRHMTRRSSTSLSPTHYTAPSSPRARMTVPSGYGRSPLPLPLPPPPRPPHCSRLRRQHQRSLTRRGDGWRRES